MIYCFRINMDILNKSQYLKMRVFTCCCCCCCCYLGVDVETLIAFHNQ